MAGAKYRIQQVLQSVKGIHDSLHVAHAPDQLCNRCCPKEENHRIFKLHIDKRFHKKLDFAALRSVISHATNVATCSVWSLVLQRVEAFIGGVFKGDS